MSAHEQVEWSTAAGATDFVDGAQTIAALDLYHVLAEIARKSPSKSAGFMKGFVRAMQATATNYQQRKRIDWCQANTGAGKSPSRDSLGIDIDQSGQTCGWPATGRERTNKLPHLPPNDMVAPFLAHDYLGAAQGGAAAQEAADATASRPPAASVNEGPRWSDADLEAAGFGLGKFCMCLLRCPRRLSFCPGATKTIGDQFEARSHQVVAESIAKNRQRGDLSELYKQVPVCRFFRAAAQECRSTLMRAAGSLHGQACKQIHDSHVADLRQSVLLSAVNKRFGHLQSRHYELPEQTNSKQSSDLRQILQNLDSDCCALSNEELNMQRQREFDARYLYGEAIKLLDQSQEQLRRMLTVTHPTELLEAACKVATGQREGGLDVLQRIEDSDPLQCCHTTHRRELIGMIRCLSFYDDSPFARCSLTREQAIRMTAAKDLDKENELRIWFCAVTQVSEIQKQLGHMRDRLGIRLRMARGTSTPATILGALEQRMKRLRKLHSRRVTRVTHGIEHFSITGSSIPGSDSDSAASDARGPGGLRDDWQLTSAVGESPSGSGEEQRAAMAQWGLAEKQATDPDSDACCKCCVVS